MKKAKYNSLDKNLKKHVGQFQSTGFPKSKGVPFFKSGDIVGFQNYFGSKEGIVKYHKYNKENDTMYVVKVHGSEHVVYEREIFMKAIKRKVLVEKQSKLFNNREIKELQEQIENGLLDISWSGSSGYNQIIISKSRRTGVTVF